MFVHALFYWAIILVALVHSHTVPGLDSLHIQSELSKRDNLVDSIYNTLPDADIDFINTHLSNLTNYNASKCDQCKHRIRYGRSLIDENPDKAHLVGLLLFKYCIVNNKGKESKCDNVDFLSTPFQPILRSLMTTLILVLPKLVHLISKIMISYKF